MATIIGTQGDDTLFGTPAGDKIFALGGRDRLTGRLGDDLLGGGPGYDTAVFTDDGGTRGVTVSLVDGTTVRGRETDRLQAIEAVVVDLAAGTATRGADVDRLVSIEGVSGSRFGDTLRGNGAENVMFAPGGNDRPFGGDGFDIIAGAAATT